MSESTVVAVPRDGTISITNGDATVYTVSFENGDMSMNLDLAERIVIYDRGTIVGLRSGMTPYPRFHSLYIFVNSQEIPPTHFWISSIRLEIPARPHQQVEPALNNFFVP